MISHARVGGATTLRWNPVNVLAWVFDVTCLAVDAILCIDLKSHSHSIFPLHILIDSSWAEVLFWSTIYGQVPFHRYRVICQRQVRRLIVVVIGPGQCHRGQKVKADLAIRFGIVYWFTVLLRLEGGVVFPVVLERPGLLTSEEPGEECCVGYSSPVTQPGVKGWANVSHHH